MGNGVVNELRFQVKGFTINLFRYDGSYHIGISSPTGDTWQVKCDDREQAQAIFYREMAEVEKGGYEFPLV